MILNIEACKEIKSRYKGVKLYSCRAFHEIINDHEGRIKFIFGNFQISLRYSGEAFMLDYERKSPKAAKHASESTMINIINEELNPTENDES